MSFLARAFSVPVVSAVFGSLALIACAEPPMEEVPPVITNPSPSKGPGDPTKVDGTVVEVEPADPIDPIETVPDRSCTDVCTAGVRRCSRLAGAGTEVCEKGASGCTVWIQGADCASGSSCDAGKNDGSCVAGCTNDAGCSASNLDAETCTAEGSRSRIKCTRVGTCFRWAAATSCSPDEACSAGECKTKCTNECTLNANKCTGSRSRQTCTKAATGCTAWTATSSCSPDETCTNGSCL